MLNPGLAQISSGAVTSLILDERGLHRILKNGAIP